MILSESSNFEQPPVGTHVARCVKILDMGTQAGEYQGKPNHARKVVFCWELPNELMTEGDYKGQPFTVSAWYTASLGEKANLRRDLANWRGRDFTPQELGGFDAKNVLGKCCMLSLTANDKNKVKVTGVMALPKGTSVPDQMNQSVYFSLDNYDPAVYASLSKFYQEKIATSPEYQARNASGPAAAPSGFSDMDDDIPF